MRTRHGMFIAALAVLCVAALAGEPPMSADEAFAKLKAYDYGKDTKALRLLERLVGKATGDPQEKAKMAEQLAGVLSDPQASEGARLFCCQQFHFAGTEAQVPLLAKLLDDPKTAEMARGALEGIGTDAARAALRAALDRAQGNAAAGLATSLGALRDEKSSEALVKLLSSPDAKIALCAAKALGRIGTWKAAAALLQAQGTTKAPVAEYTDALLGCAERVGAGDTTGAGSIYEQLWGKDSPSLVRIAALRGLVKTRRGDALPSVREAMASNDAALLAAATGLLEQIPDPPATAAMVGLLGLLKGPALAGMVGALGDRGDKTARDSVLGLIEHPDEPVRIAALKALGKLGDASTVERLAAIAGSSSALAGVARASLARLSGPGVDAA
ncbi:MAG: HEAT repeat domain-containing protein, partial [Planctomycetota bacterium]|nr:HEAT repeat domain-containing protein [Planctomycetota bacterium]